MWSCQVEVGHIPIENPLELLLVEDQQVVKAFLSYTSQEAFADRISSGSVIRRFKNLHVTRGRHSSETGAKFTIVIPNQILWCLPIRRGFSELLRHPWISRRPCHAHVDDLPRLEFDDEERKERSKEEICDLYEVASPDLC